MLEVFLQRHIHMYPLVIIILHILFTFNINNPCPVKSVFHLVSPVLHIQNLKPACKVWTVFDAGEEFS